VVLDGLAGTFGTVDERTERLGCAVTNITTAPSIAVKQRCVIRDMTKAPFTVTQLNSTQLDVELS